MTEGFPSWVAPFINVKTFFCLIGVVLDLCQKTVSKYSKHCRQPKCYSCRLLLSNPQLAKLVVAGQPLVFFLVYDPLLHWHFLCLPSCGLLPISGDFSIKCTLCICTNRLMETCVTCILFLFIPIFSNFVPCKIWASNSDGKMEGSILKLVKLVLWRFKNIKATWAVAICCKAPTVCPYLKSHSSCSTRMKTCCFKI